jgi:D-arabinose 5-phosphate isomerase GutQ
VCSAEQKYKESCLTFKASAKEVFMHILNSIFDACHSQPNVKKERKKKDIDSVCSIIRLVAGKFVIVFGVGRSG